MSLLLIGAFIVWLAYATARNLRV
ncbi:hypothetical protein CcrC2_gp466 [Caulobacter phage C2]|nr:hypothetical protein CcrC2_gp466 [Caulobacter phage C2]